ncbi:hypothetical protein L1887_27253 [Cichorium endivia]|nr:hypothetical protein L1887_27253 [Cichorium endivia]
MERDVKVGMLGEQAEPRFDRVAWIQIVGLPLHLWGEKNFSAITSIVGITIAHFDEIYSRVDLSHAKIGILTARRCRINEEVLCSIDGKTFKIGIVEFDDHYWFPFHLILQREKSQEDPLKNTNMARKKKASQTLGPLTGATT